MVGIHFEVMYGQEDWESDVCLPVTVYGASLDEARAWGEQEAWNYIHQERPSKRVLKSKRSAQVGNYLITPEGRRPVDFIELREVNARYSFEELREFGIGSGGRVGDSRMASASPPAGEHPRPDPQALANLETLRAELEKVIPVGAPSTRP